MGPFLRQFYPLVVALIFSLFLMLTLYINMAYLPVHRYGQTGTGKTHTMGILRAVSNQHQGIIPRALGHIFGHIAADPVPDDWTVSISFLQVKRT